MADEVMLERINELHAVIANAWKTAHLVVPFKNVTKYGIVYKIKDKDGRPNDAERVPWCRVTLVFGGDNRRSIGGLRSTQGGELLAQVFVPNAEDIAGAISLRLADYLVTALENHRGRCDILNPRVDGNGDGGGFASALVAANFRYEKFKKGT